MRAIRFSIESRLENLPSLGVAVRAACTQAGMDEVDSYQAELAVIESATNAIKYAYCGMEGHLVDVIMTLDQDKIEFSIEDSGISMNSDGKTWPDFESMNTANLPGDGIGLFIIKQTMDKVFYSSEAGRNIMVMTRYLKEK